MIDNIDRRSLAQLVGDAFQQTSKLLQNEIDLAKAEIAEKASQITSSVAFFAAGGLFIVPALTLGLFALAATLVEHGWSQAAAYLLAAVLATIIAAMLFAVGIHRLDARRLVPDETLTQLQKDKQLAKRIVR
jgi:membrane protein implicated in regulation of membrane protease activity